MSSNQMENFKQGRKYKKITYDDRLRLIQLVCDDNHTCASAAKLYNFSPSTVKMIIKKYKEQGKVFEKKTDKQRRQLIQELEKKNRESSRTQNYPLPQNNNQFYFYLPFQQPTNPLMMYQPFQNF